MTLHEKIELLWEKDRICSVMVDFGHALDTGDWALYRACLIDRPRIDFARLTGHGEIEVDADDWVAFASAALSPAVRHHSYGNYKIEVDGAAATARTYMVARHFKPTDNGSPYNTQYGWYEADLAKGDDDKWRIARLRHWFQWVSGNAALFDFSEPAVSLAFARVFNEQNLVSR